VVEPGAFGSFIGKLDLFFEQGKLVRSDYALLDVDPIQQDDNKAMNQLIDDVELDWEESIYKVVGYSTIPLYRYFVIENPIDTLVLQALHHQFPETDIVLSNGFRFCPPRTTPNNEGLIPITNGFIVDMLPVDSTVRKGMVSGQQLLDWLEKELNNVFAADASKRLGGWIVKFKGMTVRFYAFKPMGQRVASVMVANKPLNPTAMYSILACERDGDPDDMVCRIKGVKEVHTLPFTLHGIMAKYVKRHSPVTPTPEKNAIALDAPDTLLSQVTGVPYTFR
jgi:2',3'-cyclic-nucleotide 2'-phosphodiesterase (5'-nucleotidase family)